MMAMSDEEIEEEVNNNVFAYETWKYLIGTEYIDGKVTHDMLLQWALTPRKKLVCVFCGVEPVVILGVLHCPICKDYKGIMPDLTYINEKEEALQKIVLFMAQNDISFKDFTDFIKREGDKHKTKKMSKLKSRLK